MIKFFIEKHMVVYTFCFFILVVGVLAYISLPRESTPEIKQPIIFVQTVYPGVAARDVESLVTRPIEEEIDGLEGVTQISSSSQQGFSFITIEFAPATEVETALRRVRQRVDVARSELPVEVNDPAVQELSSSDWPKFIVVLSHPQGLQVIDEAAKNLRDRLKRIKGALNADISGNLDKEVAIELDPAKLEHYGFSLDDISQAIQSENVSIPGGLLKSPAKNYNLAVTGEITNPAVFEEIVITRNDVKVRLGELGTAVYQWAEPETIARLNGKPGISISVKQRTGENIVRMADTARDIIDTYKKSLPPGTEVTITYDESESIREIIKDLENNMLSGFLLVMLVTVIFLGLMNSFFVSLAIPFSMLLSFFMLQLLGITLNMIVLFSLIIALGMLVDNGIVIVENIHRHATLGKDRVQAAIDGTTEVAWPVTTSTLTTVLAFLPLLFWPGIMGDFMKYLPITVMIVLTNSLLVALTINPVFLARFLKITEKDRKKSLEGGNWFVAFQNWYAGRLRVAVAHPVWVVGGIFVLVLLGVVLYGIFGKEPIFFPQPDPSTAVINLETAQGTPLQVTDGYIRKLEGAVLSVPASIKHVQAVSGRAEGDFLNVGGDYNKGSVRIEFKPYLERKIRGKDSQEGYKKLLNEFLGANVKLESVDYGPPTGHDISYEVVGEDFAAMGTLAIKISELLKKYPEFSLVDSDYQPARPEIAVRILRDKGAHFGLSTMKIASTIRNAINGTKVGVFRDAKDEYDIMLRYKQAYRNSLGNLLSLQVVNSQGERVPLGAVAVVDQTSSVGVIQRRNLLRAIGIWADFRENIQNKAAIKKELDMQIRELNKILPPTYHIQAGAGLEVRQESEGFLVNAYLIALFLIMAVLIAQFNSLSEPLIIMASVLLAIGGVFWGYLLSGQVFVIIMSGLGLIALAGVVVNNCIVLTDYTNILVRSGVPYGEAVVEAGRTRLRPVLLTAITTVLGLVPMALGISIDLHFPHPGVQWGSETGEFWRAFSLSMIFGLTFATIMTLVVVPTLLKLRLGFLARRKKA